ncbi:MAG: dihydropteroate synthase [Proteobacteria bacterium]|nr:dihydropteroate synthase [Pseudomonadota bacterium]
MIARDAPVARGPRATPAANAADLPDLLARRRPLVMGILNVTPDSFSDGGQFLNAHAALAHARAMVAAGADLIDAGAESTRPYGDAQPVPGATEKARLAGVLPDLVALGVPVSLDTMKSEIAQWALDHGAAIINDVWGLQRDPGMAALAARRGVPVIVMHNRERAEADIDIMADMEAFFARSLDIAERAGMARARIVLDPGIGFGKTPQQSMIALAQLARLRRFGLPILVGASRKRFIASVSPAPPRERIGGSIAAALLAATNGADILRVHDVGETLQALRVNDAIRGCQ